MTIESIYPYPLKKEKILNERVEMAYVETGKGEDTLLFVHGLAHSSIAWLNNFTTLSDKYRCIAIDLPGNGHSSQGDYPYGMHFFAESIADFIRKKKLQNVHLIGHSMGGQISITTELLYPSLIKSLILCAPAGLETFTDWEKSLYKNTMFFVDMINSEESSLKKAIHNSFYLFPNNASQLTDQLVKLMYYQEKGHYRKMIEGCISGMLEESVYDRLQNITVPVLIMFGENDNLIPNKFIHPISTSILAKNAVAKIPKAQLSMFKECGHFVQWEKASAVNSEINHFIAFRNI